MPTISVIVPVYKVEEYLDRCVQSILDQTYTDFELILVDDGSPDNCGAMCDAWEQKDTRIRVIHKENGGLSDARNWGIERARGQYLGFVDSDDFIHPQMLEIMLDTLIRGNSQIVCCDYMHVNQTIKIYPRYTLPREVHTVPGRRVLEGIVDRYAFAQVISACNKLYKRDVFATLRYPKGLNAEDDITSYPLYYGAEKVTFIDVQLYYCYNNPSSITRGNVLFGISATQAQVEKIKFLRDKDMPKLMNKVGACLCKAYIDQYVIMRTRLKDNDTYMTAFRKLKKEVCLCWKEVLFSREAGIVQKTAWILAVFNNSFAVVLHKKYLS